MANDSSDRVAMWQTYVQTAENTSNRREAINRYMVPIHLAIFAAHLIRDFAEPVEVWLGVAGVAIGSLWIIILDSHYKINKVKYEIICSLESELPCRPFSAEAAQSGISARRRRLYPSLAETQFWGACVVVGVHVVITIGFSFWW